MFYIDLSDDSITEIGSFVGDAWAIQTGKDIFQIGSDWFVIDVDNRAGDDYVRVLKWVDPEEVALHLKLERKSIIFILGKLAREGKINMKASGM